MRRAAFTEKSCDAINARLARILIKTSTLFATVELPVVPGIENYLTKQMPLNLISVADVQYAPCISLNVHGIM